MGLRLHPSSVFSLSSTKNFPSNNNFSILKTKAPSVFSLQSQSNKFFSLDNNFSIFKNFSIQKKSREPTDPGKKDRPRQKTKRKIAKISRSKKNPVSLAGPKGPRAQGPKGPMGPRGQGAKGPVFGLSLSPTKNSPTTKIPQGAKGPRGQRAKEPRGQGAKEPRGQGAKGPRGQGAKGPRGQGAKGPMGLRLHQSSVFSLSPTKFFPKIAHPKKKFSIQKKSREPTDKTKDKTQNCSPQKKISKISRSKKNPVSLPTLAIP
jgi:hypothetical protein